MVQSTGVDQMTGMFKEVYGDDVVRAVPNTHLLANDVKFVPDAQREGLSYNVPVLLTREHGHNFNLDGSAFTLNGAFSDQSQNASINGAEYVLQTQLSYGAMQKATAAGKKAFANATKHKVKAAVEAASFIREYNMLYGCGDTPDTAATGAIDNLGEVLTETDTGTGTSTWVLTQASWSTGLWSGMEGAQLDVHDSDGTQRNATANIVVASVDPDTRSVLVTGVETELEAVVPGDYIRFAGARAKEMYGSMRVAGHTSGALHGINATTYQLWQGSQKAVGGALTFSKLMEGLSRPTSLGFQGEMNVYVPVNAWQDINEDQAALRRYTNTAGGKVAQGAEKLCFYGQTGLVNIVPHIFMKQGSALALPKGKCVRIGATDTTFEMPDGQGKIFRQLDSKAGVEFRAYYNQSFFTASPAFTVLYSGITSSGDV